MYNNDKRNINHIKNNIYDINSIDDYEVPTTTNTQPTNISDNTILQMNTKSPIGINMDSFMKHNDTPMMDFSEDINLINEVL